MNNLKKIWLTHLQPIILLWLVIIFWIYRNNGLSGFSDAENFGFIFYLPFVMAVIFFGWGIWKRKMLPMLTAVTLVVTALVSPPFHFGYALILLWLLIPICSYLFECTLIRRRRKYSIIALGVMLLCIIGMFLTPKTAVRMCVITNGHPTLALTTKVKKNNYAKNHTQYTNRGDYVISHSFVDKSTGAQYDEFSIHREGIFYIATLNYKEDWV